MNLVQKNINITFNSFTFPSRFGVRINYVVEKQYHTSANVRLSAFLISLMFSVAFFCSFSCWGAGNSCWKLTALDWTSICGTKKIDRRWEWEKEWKKCWNFLSNVSNSRVQRISSLFPFKYNGCKHAKASPYEIGLEKYHMFWIHLRSKGNERVSLLCKREKNWEFG